MVERREKAPTLLDVAMVAGVSSATAGRAMSGYGNVNPDMAARVHHAATTLGYRPNALARSMRARKTGTFGFVGADIENAFFARVVRGITDVAGSRGIELMITNTDESHSAERNKTRLLLEKQVDGMIVAPAGGGDPEHLHEITRAGVPLVLLDRSVPGVGADCVLVDGTRAATQAIDHLIFLGHRDIAIVSEASDDVADRLLANPDNVAGTDTLSMRQSGARLLGFIRAHRAVGLAINRRNVLSSAGYSGERAHAAVLDRFKSNPPTALFASDYVMTMAAYRALLDLGLRVPDEVSFVGFDDLEWTSLLTPPLTVVSQPVYRLGEIAAQRLLARIDGDTSDPVRITPETELLLRRSTAPPAAAP